VEGIEEVGLVAAGATDDPREARTINLQPREAQALVEAGGKEQEQIREREEEVDQEVDLEVGQEELEPELGTAAAGLVVAVVAAAVVAGNNPTCNRCSSR